MHYRIFRIIFCSLFIFFNLEVWAQTPVVVNKITGQITFDGIPDEASWESVPSLPMVMHTPVFGNEPSETSIIKMAYDNEYFYISGYLNYKDPADMRAIGRKRDYSVATCDWFGIIIDTFNDRKNAVSFWTNPNGLRTDGTSQNDVSDPENDLSFSWNTFWDVKTRITDQGWSVEFRIPFSSLRFQVKEEKTLMGICLVRYSPVKAEFSTFPPVPPNFTYSIWKPSNTAIIEFSGLKPKKPVYFAPYLTAGLGQVNELTEQGNAYKMISTLKYDAGIDLKYPVTNNLTADLTINTDFAQVEADDQKINLTRYSLFFPEKRVFFQEKADVFDFPFLGGNNMFYSRRIGLYYGSPVRILGGARITGRINKWDIGILDLQTSVFEENPSENFGVIRTKRAVFNPNSYIGGIATTRLGTDGSYNLGYGLDGVVRVTGDEYLTVRWAQTFERDSVIRLFDMAPSRFLFNWEHRDQKGFGYDFVYTWSGDRFNPGIGFEVKDNYQGFRGILRQGWLPKNENSIRYHRISLTMYEFRNTLNNLHETTSAELLWYFEAKKGFSGSAGVLWQSEDLAEDLDLGINQALVPKGRYRFSTITTSYSTSYSHAVSTILNAEAGSFYDGIKLSFSATPMLNIGSGLSFNLSYNIDYLNFSARSVRFTNHIAGIKGLLTLTTRTSLSAFIQYNTAVDRINSNIRFRFNPREGNDLWLVYDEGLNTDIRRETPSLPYSSGRTILAKYTYTFRF